MKVEIVKYTGDNTQELTNLFPFSILKTESGNIFFKGGNSTSKIEKDSFFIHVNDNLYMASENSLAIVLTQILNKEI